MKWSDEWMTHCRDMAIWNFQDGGPVAVLDLEVSEVLFCYFSWLSHLSWTAEKVQKLTNLTLKKYDFGGHVGFFCCHLGFETKFKGAQDHFQIDGIRYMNPLRKPWLEKGSFYLAWTCLSSFICSVLWSYFSTDNCAELPTVVQIVICLQSLQ